MKRPRGSRFIAGAAAVALSLAASAARGQDEAATAEALFREARGLIARGDFAAACPKLAASQKLDPGFGTLYNLGECLSRTGRTASAWAAFQEAAAMAKTAGQSEREAKANRAAAALEPRLERVILSVEAPAPGMVVQRGGVGIDAPAWGSALPVDPGTYRVEARAPGRKAFSVEVHTGGSGKTVTVVIPPLEMEAPAAVGPRAALPAGGAIAPAEDRGAGRRVAGYVVGGVGVVGLVVGAVMGVSAKAKWDEAQRRDCVTADRCNAEGVALVNSAKGSATGATVGFVAGGALLATGVVLFVTALPAKVGSAGGDRRIGIAPWLEGRRGGVVLSGSF